MDSPLTNKQLADAISEILAGNAGQVAAIIYNELLEV